jgi:predicted transcriptional regulator
MELGYSLQDLREILELLSDENNKLVYTQLLDDRAMSICDLSRKCKISRRDVVRSLMKLHEIGFVKKYSAFGSDDISSLTALDVFIPTYDGISFQRKFGNY